MFVGFAIVSRLCFQPAGDRRAYNRRKESLQAMAAVFGRRDVIGPHIEAAQSTYDAMKHKYAGALASGSSEDGAATQCEY